MAWYKPALSVRDCTRLRTETGWQPRLTFAQALARTWAWYAWQHQAAL